jgi:hypothetical protein
MPNSLHVKELIISPPFIVHFSKEWNPTSDKLDHISNEFIYDIIFQYFVYMSSWATVVSRIDPTYSTCFYLTPQANYQSDALLTVLLIYLCSSWIVLFNVKYARTSCMSMRRWLCSQLIELPGPYNYLAHWATWALQLPNSLSHLGPEGNRTTQQTMIHKTLNKNQTKHVGLVQSEHSHRRSCRAHVAQWAK